MSMISALRCTPIGYAVGTCNSSVRWKIAIADRHGHKKWCPVFVSFRAEKLMGDLLYRNRMGNYSAVFVSSSLMLVVGPVVSKNEKSAGMNASGWPDHASASSDCGSRAKGVPFVGLAYLPTQELVRTPSDVQLWAQLRKAAGLASFACFHVA